MNPVSVFVDPVETPVRAGVAAGHVVAVVGKLLAWREARRFTDNLVAFDDQPGAVGMHHHPFAAEESHRLVGGIPNGDEVDERMRLIRRQAGAPVVVAEFVQ